MKRFFFGFIILFSTLASATDISFPKDFFVEQINAKECSVGNKNTNLEWIKDIAQINANDLFAKDTSLTVNHNQLSKRWAELLRITYIAAGNSDKQLADDIIDILVYIAKAEALLLTSTDTDGQCWKGGNKNAKCAYHTPQHTGFAFHAMLYSAIILKEYITLEQKEILDEYFDQAYEKFISPLAVKPLHADGFYEFGDYGLGVLAYAHWTDDKRLASKEIKRRYQSIKQKIESTGYIDNNSYRGNRGYWYHTLGANSIYGYAIVARAYGFDFFKDPKLGPKLKAMALKTLEGEINYNKFVSKGNRGNNASKDPKDARPHMHQMAVSLPIIILNEYGIEVGNNHKYRELGGRETIDRFIGFNADCYYNSK